MRLACFMVLIVILTGAAMIFLLDPQDRPESTESTHPPSEKQVQPEPDVTVPPPRRVMDPIRYDATVLGCFKDIHDAGLHSVKVELACKESVQATVSNRNGVFAVTVETESDQERQAILEARKLGFATYSARITILPGEVVDLGDLVMERGGSVSGCVVDKRGMPVARATVFLLDQLISIPDPRLISWRHFGPPDTRRHEVRTAKDGTFRMKGVPPGWIQVWAGAEGMMYAHTFGPIEVRAGWETPGIKLKLLPMPASEIIEGQVLSPTGAPVPGAKVRVDSVTLEADGQGFFRFFRNSRSRKYQIKAWDPEGRFKSAVLKNVSIGTHDLILRLGRKDPAEE